MPLPCVHDPSCRHLAQSLIVHTCDHPRLHAAQAYGTLDNVTCFHTAVMRYGRGPSGEVMAGNWGESHFLVPIYMAALGGTCYHPDGSRKVVLECVRLRTSEGCIERTRDHSPHAPRDRCSRRTSCPHKASISLAFSLSVCLTD